MKIGFAPLNLYVQEQSTNMTSQTHNATISRLTDVTDQLWWRHNAKSENTFLGDKGEMNDRWLFIAELCVQDMK